MIGYENLRAIFFKLDAEMAHDIGSMSLSFGAKIPWLLNYLVDKNFIVDDVLKQNIFGRDFLNPVGIGAGFDKDAKLVDALMGLGFGYAEVGTITPKAQSGNEKPRLFRHIEEEALQNAMGFNNSGAHALSRRVKKLYPHVLPIGVNIGKNRDTPLESAMDDYENLIREFHTICDYLVINISSPNTKNLRDLQNIEFIKALFTKAREITNRAILLKISPDMSIENTLEVCEVAIDCGASGIIATNTSTDYSLVENPKDVGGISGKPLKEKSREILKEIASNFFNKTVLISVGGIDSKEEALERLKIGASLIQIYTSLIYRGPQFVKEINTFISQELEKEGLKNIKDLIGISQK